MRAKLGIAKITAVLTVVIIVLAIVAGIGWSGIMNNNSSAAKSLSTTTQYEDLVALAKTEGTVTIYGQVDTAAWNQYITAAFEQAYPWAHVVYQSGTSGDNLNKELAEAKSGAVHSDVIEQLQGNFVALENASAIQAWYNPAEAMMGYPSSVLDPTNYTHPFDLNQYFLIYNTNLVKNTSVLPKTWTDIANPIWKGKLAIDDPSRLSATGGLFAMLKQNMSSTDWTNFLKSVAANQPYIVSSSGGVYNDVSSGQAAIGIGATTDLVAGLSKGAPVGYEWLNPVPIQPTPVGISKGAPDPYMAELFVEWVTSWAGQYAIGQSSRPPAFGPAAQQTILSQLSTPLPSSFTQVNFANEIGTSASFYTSTYTQIFGK
ncbi:MAG: extracellular solute-binding protein [Nitrososphaerota archaeon]|nr:extracellular solute-binding protein [Nitrososphaerota archaeon]